MNLKNKFPDNLIKGIKNDSFLSDGYPAASLFYFEESKTDRPDDCLVQSINWDDDADAIPFTLQQKRGDGMIHFRAGVALIPRTRIDQIAGVPAVARLLSYERDTFPGNDYHGNLLLAKSIPVIRMKLIAASIALHVSQVIPNTNPI